MKDMKTVGILSDDKVNLKIPVSRLLINTPGALGGIGGSTNLVLIFVIIKIFVFVHKSASY